MTDALLNILLVEDSPADAALVREQLRDDPAFQCRIAHAERLGYAVTACTSSQEALGLFQTSPHNFDLVITDYTMPHMTGESLAQAFRQIRPDIPIILTTGFSPMAPEQAQAFGIETVLSKPWMARDLARTIQRVLAERRSEHV